MKNKVLVFAAKYAVPALGIYSLSWLSDFGEWLYKLTSGGGMIP